MGPTMNPGSVRVERSSTALWSQGFPGGGRGWVWVSGMETLEKSRNFTLFEHGKMIENDDKPDEAHNFLTSPCMATSGFFERETFFSVGRNLRPRELQINHG